MPFYSKNCFIFNTTTTALRRCHNFPVPGAFTFIFQNKVQNVSNIKVALGILKVFFLLHLLTSGDDREHFTAPTIFLLELTRLTFWLGIKSYMSKHCYVFECFTVWDLWHLISWTGPSFILSSSLLEARRLSGGSPEFVSSHLPPGTHLHMLVFLPQQWSWQLVCFQELVQFFDCIIEEEQNSLKCQFFFFKFC